MYNIKEFTTSDWGQLRFDILETALGSGLVGTYLLDVAQRQVFADPSLCAMFGLPFSPAGIQLNSFTSRIHPDDLKRTNQEREASLSQGDSYLMEYKALSESNAYRWLLVRAGKKKEGDINYYYGVVVDIHERKLAEEALLRQSHLTRTIADNATSAMFMMDQHGYCTFMNSAANRLTGYSFEEISQKPLHYMIHHSHPDGSFFPIEECPIDRALPENFDIRAHEDTFFRKDGSAFPVSCAASPIFENGIPVATVIEVRDLTQQKKSEATILRKTNNLRILNRIGQSVSEGLDLQSTLQRVTDTTTQYTRAEFGAFFYNQLENGQSLMLFTLSGVPREAFEKFGMPRNTQIFHPTLIGQEVVRVDDIRTDKRYGQNSPHFGIPEGHLSVVSYMSIPVISKSGEVLGGLFFGHSQPGIFTKEAEEMVIGVATQAAIAIDNSRLYEELKKQNIENERLLELSQESEKKKDEFISIASHELKTPLTTTKAYIQLSQKISDSRDRGYSLITKAEEQLSRLEKLVADLLDVSKIQAGKMIYDIEPFAFDRLLIETVGSIQLTSTSHKIIIEKSDRVEFNGDKSRIEQVLNNFLSNAIKYSPDSKKVVILSELKHGNIIVSVQDFGIGIDEIHLEGIFDRFYRVDNTAIRYQGLGLGLFISSEIIKRHGGSFWIESEPGTGSTFYFLLPLNGKLDLKVLSGDDQTFYRSNFLEVNYNAQRQWLESSWIGYQNFESVKTGCLVMLDLLKKNQCSKVINDNSQVVGNWSEAVDWGNEIWFPAMANAGLKYFAWIYSPSTFARISARRTLNIVTGSITSQFFTERELAFKWLEGASFDSIN